MVSEHDEENEEQKKSDRKASTPKTNAFEQFNNVIDTSCTKINELFCCQRVAHSVIFYVIIFLFLLVLVYIFRKLVSLPNSNGRYNGRKHNTSTSTTGSRLPSNDLKGLPARWPTPNPILGSMPTTLSGSADLNSVREKKTRIYGVPGSGLQEHSGFLNSHKNLKTGENSNGKVYGSLDGVNEFKYNTPTINTYSSSSLNNNDPQSNQGSTNEPKTSNSNTANWPTANQISSNGYGSSAKSSTSNSPSSSVSTTNQNDWSSRDQIGNTGSKQYNSNWENSWNSAPWDSNSNTRSWGYSGSSGSGLTKVNQKTQQESRYLPEPTRTPNVNSYETWSTPSRSKLGQSGSGFGWINDKVDSYKSPTTPSWSNYYYDNASGKWRVNNNNVYAYKSDSSSPQNIARSNSYATGTSQMPSSYNWNPYAEYWGANKTQDWNSWNSNDPATVNGNTGDKVWNYGTTYSNNANGEKDEDSRVTSISIQQDESDEKMHRWPLEESRKEKPVNKLPARTFFTSKRKNYRKPHKKDKKAKIRKTSGKKKKVNKGNHNKRNHVKKSSIPRARNLKSTKRNHRWGTKSINLKKNPAKAVSRKVSHKKKQMSRKRNSKFMQRNSYITTSNKKRSQKHRELSHNQNSVTGKWQRKVHHVKHCKNLQDIYSNGRVHMDRKYLQKKRKYKYTVLSCRYVRIQKRLKSNRRYRDVAKNDDDSNFDDDDDDEVPSKRKQVCRKSWFITNGRILLHKTAKRHGEISYTVLLCRAGAEHYNNKHDKIRTNHYHKTTLYPPNDDVDDVHLGETHKGRDSNDDLDEDKTVAEQIDKNEEDRKTKQTKHMTHNKVINNDDNNYTGDIDDDIEGRDDTYKENNKHTKKGKHENNDDDTYLDDNVDRETDTDDDIDGNHERADEPKHIIEDVDEEDIDELKKTDDKTVGNEKSDDSDNDFYAKGKLEDIDSHKATETNKYSKKPSKKKQNDNDEEEDIDDIDDIDSGKQDGSTTQQTTHDNVHDDSDDGLDNDGLGDDLDDDIDNDDLMDVKLDTAARHKQTISSKLHKEKETRNRHKSVAHEAKNHNKDNKNLLYERLLDELTSNEDTNDKSNGPKNLLAAILKKKLNSASSHKHTKLKTRQIKPSHITSRTNMAKKKRKHQFAPLGAQNDKNIKDLLKGMLTNSIGVKSLSQVIRTQPQEKDEKLHNVRRRKHPQTGTSKPPKKPSMADLLKAFLPNVLRLGKPTPTPTQPATEASTRPGHNNKIAENSQIANLLKKFVIQNNKNRSPTKAVTTVVSSKRRTDNLQKDSNSISIPKVTYTNPVTAGVGVPPYKPPTLPAQPPVTYSRAPSTTLPPPPLQQQQQVPTSSPRSRYLNLGPYQEQANIQRSTIPTIKPRPTLPVSQPTQTPISQPRQQVKTPYGYSAYASRNTNQYGSYETQQSTNVLCFGDSLTSGYYNHGRGKHPYSIKLNQLLNPAGSHHYHIETRGVVGEMAHGSMAKRLPKVLNEGTHYDWVLILGGTNDVAHVKNFGDDQDFTRQLISIWSPKIVKDIEKLHEIARRYGSRTVLMTIPETAYELWPAFRSIRNMRLSVNAAIRKYAEKVRDTTVLCDLAYKLPRSTLSKEMQKLYWNDHIHLNPVGYNKMAQIIEECIQPYLS